MKIEIKNRFTGETIASDEAENLCDALIKLVANKADLSGANLRGAYLRGADLGGADLGGADVPVVPNLHSLILESLDAGGKLDMRGWHSCETTHCRAGWAIHLAGKAGYALESKIGSCAAGALISVASCPQLHGKVPDFYASDHAALSDIRRLAELENAT